MEKDCRSEMNTLAARQDDKYPTVLDLADKVRTLEKAQNDIAKAQAEVSKGLTTLIEGQSNLTRTLQTQFASEHSNRTLADNPPSGPVLVDQFGFPATAGFPTFQPISQPGYYPYRPPVAYTYPSQKQPEFYYPPPPRYAVRSTT